MMSAPYELASVSDNMPRAANHSTREINRDNSDFSDNNDSTAIHVNPSERNPFATASTILPDSQQESSKNLLNNSTENTRRIALKTRERQKMIFGFILLAIGLILSTIQTVSMKRYCYNNIMIGLFYIMRHYRKLLRSCKQERITKNHILYCK
jgi:hypothetical protein